MNRLSKKKRPLSPHKETAPDPLVWHPTHLSLPAFDRRVLITDVGGNISICALVNHRTMGPTWRAGGPRPKLGDSGTYSSLERAIAWMPLPEPFHE